MTEKLLQVLVMLAVTSAGCSLIRVNGKPLGGGAVADNASGAREDRSASSGHGAQQQAVASVRAPASEPLLVQAAFGPNPLVISGQPGTTDKDVLSLHGDNRSSCSGWVTSTPAMTLDIAEPSEGLEVTAPGFDVLYVDHDGQYRCDSPTTTSTAPKVSLAGWSGRVEVYVGMMSNRKTIGPVVALEDMARPRTLAWLDDAEAIKLRTRDKKAKVVSLNLPELPRTPQGVMGCVGYNFRAQPDLVFRLDEPLTGTSFSIRSPGPTSLMISGPIPEHHRDIPVACYKDNVATPNRLERGLYAISVGTKGAPAPASLVMLLQGAERDPLAIASSIPDNLELDARRLVHHFPMLQKDDVLDADGIRRDLFLKAPRSLFMYPAFDMNAETAQSVARVGHGGDTAPPKGSPRSYPKKNEPLLAITEGLMISADGHLFQVNPKDLVTEPSGPIAVPKGVRNPGLSLGYSLNAAESDGNRAEKSLLASARKVQEQRDNCHGRIWAPVQQKLTAIKKGPYSTARQERILAIEGSTHQKVGAQCEDPYWQRASKIWKQLETERTKRRAQSLRTVTERLNKLFR